MELENLARKFVNLYQSKDITSITQMFEHDVVLRDWNREVIGLEAAVAEFQGNFDAAEELKLTINEIFVRENSVAVRLEILVNKTDQLNVVDIIHFSASGKIKSIIAFKGL